MENGDDISKVECQQSLEFQTECESLPPYNIVTFKSAKHPRALHKDEFIIWTYHSHVKIPSDTEKFSVFALTKQADIHRYSQFFHNDWSILVNHLPIGYRLPFDEDQKSIHLNIYSIEAICCPINLIVSYLAPFVMTWLEFCIELDTLYGKPMETNGMGTTFIDDNIFIPRKSKPCHFFPATFVDTFNGKSFTISTQN